MRLPPRRVGRLACEEADRLTLALLQTFIASSKPLPRSFAASLVPSCLAFTPRRPDPAATSTRSSLSKAFSALASPRTGTTLPPREMRRLTSTLLDRIRAMRQVRSSTLDLARARDRGARAARGKMSSTYQRRHTAAARTSPRKARTTSRSLSSLATFASCATEASRSQTSGHDLPPTPARRAVDRAMSSRRAVSFAHAATRSTRKSSPPRRASSATARRSFVAHPSRVGRSSSLMLSPSGAKARRRTSRRRRRSLIGLGTAPRLHPPSRRRKAALLAPPRPRTLASAR